MFKYESTIESKTWDAARKFAEGWLPSQNIVMDIAELRTGEFKIIEFNSLNSSGFYCAEIDKIVVALETLMQ